MYLLDCRSKGKKRPLMPIPRPTTTNESSKKSSRMEDVGREVEETSSFGGIEIKSED